MMKRYVVVLAVVMFASGCASNETLSKSTVEPAPASVAAKTRINPGLVDGADAHKLVAAGVTVVDVRTPQEFQTGHIPGALNIPHDQMGSRYREIGAPTTAVLLYCRTGRRSGLAANTLREKGYTELYDLQAYSRWVASEPTGGR